MDLTGLAKFARTLIFWSLSIFFLGTLFDLKFEKKVGLFIEELKPEIDTTQVKLPQKKPVKQTDLLQEIKSDTLKPIVKKSQGKRIKPESKKSWLGGSRVAERD